MKNLRIFLILFVCIIALSGCFSKETKDERITRKTIEENGPGLTIKEGAVKNVGDEERLTLANPASVFCEDQGYKLELRGSEGYCVFGGGEECEEWAFFRKECGNKYWSDKIGLKEISRHNLQNDCWMIIKDKVYNATEYLPSYPGENSLVSGCGKDGTKIIESYEKRVMKVLDKYYLGELRK